MSKKQKTTQKPNPSKSAAKNPSGGEEELTGFAKAWNNWLMYVVFVVVLAGAFFTVYLGLLSNQTTGLLLAAGALLLPTLMVIQKAVEAEGRARTLLPFGVGLTALALVAAAWPIVSPFMQERTLFEHEFRASEEAVEAPKLGRASRSWIMEVSAELKGEKDRVYVAPYGLSLKNADDAKLIKGSLARREGRDAFRRETILQEDRDLHFLSFDLSDGATLTLTELGGDRDQTLVVRILAEPLSWFWFLAVYLPLILLATVVDLFEKPSNKYGFYTGRVTFILIFTFVYVNNIIRPGSWAGPILFSLVMGMVTSLAAARLLPILLNLVLRRS